jgi:hypothetical protein
MRDLMLAVALCGRFERKTFLRNDGNCMTNDTSSASPSEHIKISYTIQYKPNSEQGGTHNWRSVLLTANTKLTAGSQYLLQLVLLSNSFYKNCNCIPF